MSIDNRDYWTEEAKKRFALVSGVPRAKTNTRKQKQIVSKLTHYDFYKKYVLEIGCGAGTLATYMMPLEPYMRYVGLDSSSGMAKAASHFGLKVICAESNNIPIQNDTFDYIFAFDVMEHIPKTSKSKTYTEIDRVLKQNGIMFINNPTSPSLHSAQVEHDFDIHDLAILCDVCSFKLERIDTIRVNEFNLTSQFMVLTR